MGSGCGDSIVDKILRPPGNSPSRWHLTRRLLLCSGFTIHDFTGIVNIYFSAFSQSPAGMDFYKETVAFLLDLSRRFRFVSCFFPSTMVSLFLREDGQCNARS